MQKVAFHTLGCKTNRYETDAIRQTFVQNGFLEVDFQDAADVYILNTCTVTGEADRKARQLLRRAKRRNPAALVVALGCSVELGLSEASIDLALGNRQKSQALAAVKRHLLARERPGAKADTAKEKDPSSGYVDYGFVTEQAETRAYVKVEDGCDFRCSYCAITLARGPVCSREPKLIRKEAEALAAAGHREIVLTGIHLCSYGRDRGQSPLALLELAQTLAKIKGVLRVRLSSLDPRFITPEWIELAGKIEGLCPHFHLSLQSGSDTVLQRMQRGYRCQDFLETVRRLRAAFDKPAITTDVMVGFPQESEKEHAQSLEFCRKIGFSRMHVFRYSPRRGTAAAAMPGAIDAALSRRRLSDMQTIATAMQTAYHESIMDLEHEVILETIDAKKGACGLSRRYVPVTIGRVANDAVPGDVVRAKALSADAQGLWAKVLPVPASASGAQG